MFPISVDPSPEAFDGRSNENVAKTFFVEGWNDGRSAALGPGDVHRSRLIGAVDFNIPARRREGAVLGGVGYELVHQQREAGNHTSRYFHVTSRNGETAERFLLVVRGGDRPDQ